MFVDYLTNRWNITPIMEIQETQEKQETKLQKLLTLFTTFFKMALFTVGGGYAMLPVMEEEFVKRKKWVKEEDIVDVLAIVQSVPGIIAVNAAVFVGNRVAGFAGGLAAGIGVVAPSYVIIVIIAACMSTLGHVDLIEKAFTGVRAGVCALILLAAISLGKKVMKGKFEWIMGIAAFVCIVIFNVNVMLIIALGGVIGVMRYYINMKNMDMKEVESSGGDK